MRSNNYQSPLYNNTDHLVRSYLDKSRQSKNLFKNQGNGPKEIFINKSFYSLHYLQLEKKNQVKNIKSALKSFFQNVKKQEIKLYGIQIKAEQSIEVQNKNGKSSIFQTLSDNVQKQKKDNYDQNQQKNINHFKNIEKAQFSEFQKLYLCSCHLLSKWEKMNYQQLDLQIQNMLYYATSNQIENIRMVGRQIKFDKSNKTLVYSQKKSLQSQNQWHQQNKCFRFDSISKKQYKKSKYYISVKDGPTYKYGSEILQIQTQAQILGIRTQNQVYISRDSENQRFKIKSSYIKWGHKGLYVFLMGQKESQQSNQSLKESQKIILIKKQRYFVSKANKYIRKISKIAEFVNFLPNISEFIIEKGQLGTWHQKDFLISCQQQMIHCSISSSNYLSIKVIGGKSTQIYLQLSNNEDIYFAEGYSNGKKIIVYIITKVNGEIYKMYEYQFLYI